MLLRVPNESSDECFLPLVKALEKCPAIKDFEKRKEIILLLGEFGNKIEEKNDVRGAIFSFLKTLSGFPNQFGNFLDAINFYEQDSIYYKKLLKVVSDIATKQQKSDTKRLVEIPATFEEMGFNNDRNETFENLWSELCLILDKIDWKDIWKACLDIKKITKNEDAEVYIKSLCFTNNYELLKQVFLDQYDRMLIIRLGELLKGNNENIQSWLDKASHQLRETGALSDPNINENRSYFPPILLIIIDRIGDGKEQGNWNVRGQFKTQDKQSELLLSPDRQGLICKTFEEIPKLIKIYIDFLENNNSFSNENINQLRIEVFLPLSEIRLNIDNWAVNSEDGGSSFLITNHRLFLRIKERTSKRKNHRISSLKEGWKRIDDFLNNELAISKLSWGEITNKTETYNNLIEILEDTNVSNWIDLTDYMEHCPSLWCISWKRTLPNDKSERMKFFGSILDSGIPIAFWNWHSIPQEVDFETEANFLCRNKLVDRCQQLLEKTWSLRRVAWGEKDEIERQRKHGYYFSMLLEDPEILPEDNPLQTIGAK